MTHSPLASPEKVRQRWQFSLWGLLLFMTSVAVGASVMEVKYQAAMEVAQQGQSGSPTSLQSQKPVDLDWNSGLTAIFIYWMILGLFYQSRDLRHFLLIHPQIDCEQKIGLHFEIFWRAAVIALLLFYAIMMILFYQNLIALPDSEELLVSLIGSGTALRETILVILLMFIVGSVPFVVRKPKFPWLHAIINIAACACAVGLCLYLWSDLTYSHYLVYIAIHGIDVAAPLKFSAIDVQNYPRECLFFFYWSLVSAGIVLCNWVSLHRLAAQWTLSRFRRWFWLGLFSLGIVAVASYVLWVYMRGLKQISPAFAEVGSSLPYHYWIAIILFFLILITALTYRMAVEYRSSSYVPRLSWRKDAGKYFHEWRFFLIALALMDVSFRGYEIISYYQLQASYPGSMRLSFFGIVASTYVYMPVGCLWLALVILSLSRAFARRSDPENPQPEIPYLNRAKFITLWLSTAAFTISGALSLVWMSFGLWFNPWFGTR